MSRIEAAFLPNRQGYNIDPEIELQQLRRLHLPVGLFTKEKKRFC
jgi:hypothetical protein